MRAAAPLKFHTRWGIALNSNGTSYHLLHWYIRTRESPRGQTLSEYALIFVALALAVFAAYQSIGNGTAALGSGVNSELTNA
jgi:Flp pilus assembly pilin Flp